ncbi:MAG TPA: hypothetical protein DD377_01020 [Firmicutes bacterium]|nr:hypothetical protein [Bacillota bacterium]HBM69985.1 hypothetical protein [Bacillota bacterium]
MVTKSQNSSLSICTLLNGETGLSFYNDVINSLKKEEPPSFKLALERYFQFFASSISASVLSPKLSSSNLENSLYYLCFYIGQSPELYGRMNAYFKDKDYYSFNTGVCLFNDFIRLMTKALDEPNLSSFYLRFKNDDSFSTLICKKELFGMEVGFYTNSIGKLSNDKKTLSLKVSFYVKDIKDNEAMFAFTILDFLNNGRSTPLIISNHEREIKKNLVMEIPLKVLLPNNQAKIGLIVESKYHVVKSNGKRNALVKEYGKVELPLFPYLKIVE